MENNLAYGIGNEVVFLQNEKKLNISLQCDETVKAVECHHNRVYVTCEETIIHIFENNTLLKTIRETAICSSENNSLFVTSNE